MKKFLAILLLALLAFSGCSLFEKEEEETQAEPETVNADTILDNQIYEQAVNASDKETCNKILDASKKEECGNVVNALLLTNKATEELNDDYCGDIKIERYEENCNESVKGLVDKKEEQEVLEKKNLEELEIAQEAMNKKDATICEGIEDKDTMYTCKLNVTVNKALQDKNPELCSQIGEEQYVEECEKSLTSY